MGTQHAGPPLASKSGVALGGFSPMQMAAAELAAAGLMRKLVVVVVLVVICVVVLVTMLVETTVAVTVAVTVVGGMTGHAGHDAALMLAMCCNGGVYHSLTYGEAGAEAGLQVAGCTRHPKVCLP